MCAGAPAENTIYMDVKRSLRRWWAKTGIIGDLAAVALFFWTLKRYVPYGQAISKGIVYLLAGMVVFSVVYVILLRTKQELNS